MPSDLHHVVNRPRDNFTPIPKLKKTLRLMILTTLWPGANVSPVSTKKVAIRNSSRYERSRATVRSLRHGILWSGALGGFRACRKWLRSPVCYPVLPDLQNSSWSKGVLARTKPLDRTAVPSPVLLPHREVALRQGGARV